MKRMKRAKRDNRTVTLHAYGRVFERTNFSNKSVEKIVKEAYSRGYHLRHFTGSFYKYLCSKQIDDGGKFSIRVYGDNVFIFENARGGIGGNSVPRLITIYPIPSSFIPYDEYIVNSDSCVPCIVEITYRDGTVRFVSEQGDFTEDVMYALEFRSYQRANNHIKNNNNIKHLVKNGAKVEIIELSEEC